MGDSNFKLGTGLGTLGKYSTPPPVLHCSTLYCTMARLSKLKQPNREITNKRERKRKVRKLQEERGWEPLASKVQA